MKIKILHFTTDSRIAGAENLLIAIADNYDKKNFDLVFCTLKKEGDLHFELRKRGFRAYSLNLNSIFDLFFSFFKFILVLKKEKPVILHTHLLHASIMGQIIGRLMLIPYCVMTRHYSDFMYIYKGVFFRLLDRLSLKLSKGIIAISKASRSILVDRDRIPEDKVFVVYNGIDLENFDRNYCNSKVTKESLGLNNDTFVMAQIGIFHPRKGHIYLLRAVSMMKEIGTKFVLLLIGDGVLSKDLKKVCDDLNINEYVRFLGYRNDVPQLLNAVDLLVQPSVEEGFGITLLEGMLASKLVLASNIGGIPEIIEDGVDGFLIPPGDASSLKNKLCAILQSYNNLIKIKERARIKVEKKFTIGNMIREYEDFYFSMTNKKKA